MPVSVYSTPLPGLSTQHIVGNTQQPQKFTFNQNIVVTATVEYNILTLATATAIMEWNIGQPIIGQIRQTAQDRMDFAY